jgi:4-hydroxybutyrate CoA-transferase
VRDRQGKIKVGLKYCGGCRAGYDRVAMVDSIRSRFAQEVEFVAADSGDAQMILIVTGCSSACAKLDDNVGNIPIRYITSIDDAERWMAEIGLRNIIKE